MYMVKHDKSTEGSNTNLYYMYLDFLRIFSTQVSHLYFLLSGNKHIYCTTALYIFYLLAMAKNSWGWLFLDLHCCTIFQSNLVSGVVVYTIWTHDSLMLQYMLPVQVRSTDHFVWLQTETLDGALLYMFYIQNTKTAPS